MKNDKYLTKITDNKKFIKELDSLLKSAAKVYKAPKKNSSFENSFINDLIIAIQSQLDMYPFFKNFKFLEVIEFELYGRLEIISKLPSKIYQDNLESVTINFVEDIDSIINNNYFISEICIKKQLENSIGEYINYSINESSISSLSWISLETFNGNFSMYLANDNYGLSTETITNYNLTGDLVDFISFMQENHSGHTKDIATILNKAFFEQESLPKETIEYYLITQDIDLSIINKVSQLFINLDNFNLDTIYHNTNQNKKTFKRSK